MGQFSHVADAVLQQYGLKMCFYLTLTVVKKMAYTTLMNEVNPLKKL